MFSSEFVFSEILGLVLVIGVGIITYYKWVFTYWERKNVRYIEKPTIPFGNLKLLATSRLQWAIYDKMKSQGLKHAGAFALFNPFYAVIDPYLIKEILQHHSDHFPGRGLYTNEKDDPLSMNLAFVEGEKWRCLHKKLTPAFTSGKMKVMFDILVRCGHKLQKAVDTKYENKETIDFSDVSTCYTLDLNGAYACGIELNSFEDPNSKFRKHVKEAIDSSSILRVAKLVFALSFPNLARQLGVRVYSKECTNFFIGIVRDGVRFRKANNIVRKDFLQLLMEGETNLDAEEIDKKTIESTNAISKIAAQVFLFLLAGYETSSLTLAYCLYELSINSYIQEKLKDEVDQVLNKYGGKITYDAIADMPYMNQVVEETLRKYPPVLLITRRCTKDCEISDTNVLVKKGMLVLIPVLGIHHDPDYYPHPERFDPERFSHENKQKRLPYTYLPFSEGLRMCPASRFGVMQIKVGLAVLVQRYVFSLNKQTPVPLEMESQSFLLVPKTAVFLDLKERN